MCGIAGILSYDQIRNSDLNNLDILQAGIHHRGPDGTGRHVSAKSAYTNVRLAIVDREGGAQPIYNHDRSAGIVYNGEVYNHAELRDQLIQLGTRFTTQTDTEVVLHAYLEWGEAAFEKLNGMFAFCIWDERNDCSYIVRDQTGIKPLYYYRDDDRVIFCSELTPILKIPGLDLTLDEAGVLSYLTFRYINGPMTCYKRISRLDAGYYLKLQGKSCTKFCYFDSQYSNPLLEQNPGDAEEYKQQLREKILNAVRLQLMGEVPIGVLLSGGVDSSIIAWCIHELGADLTTYNIGFPEVNEFVYSRGVAKAFGLKHVEICTSPNELIKDFDLIVKSLDEPLADPACFPLFQLCRELKKAVTVVLSGEGGDELFGGYPQYVRTLQELNNNIDLTPESSFETFLDYSYYFRNAAQFLISRREYPARLLHRKYYLGHSFLNSMLSYDMHTWMPQNLMMKADKILMTHSLEGRFPFLDLDLQGFVNNIPEQLKISSDWTTKWLLKESFKDILPQEILTRPKMGFSVPVESMLEEMKDRVLDSISGLKGHQLSDILDLENVTKLFREHFNNTHRAPLQVWTIFILLSWFRQ